MYSVLVVLLSAIAYMLVGYVKDKVKKGEAFDIKKASPTLIFGVVIAGLVYYFGVDIATAEGLVELFMAIAGINVFVDKAILAYIRK